VLSFLQREAGMEAREAYGTFNMGAGFAVFVPAEDAERAVAVARKAGVDAWAAGSVEAGPRRLVIEPLGVEYAGSELGVRL
jgi:phosphoribosylformylglycinamidine cyclo-ligase